jgi:signal transduction histidine kinase/CheY-like chemotaxis protein
MNPEARRKSRRFSRLVSGSFLLLIIALESMIVAYWSLLLEPRLREEAGANAEILAQAQGPLLVNVLLADRVDRTDVLGVLDHLLLRADPVSDSPFFVGVALEVDYDVVAAEEGSLDMTRGPSECKHCFPATVEVYSEESFELLGVASLLVSDAFFKKLRNDVRNKMIAEGVTILLLILLAWVFVAALVRRLHRQIEVRQQAEEDLREAKEQAESANRAKSVFLANMSHEIRTPMNAILGYAQILESDPDLTDKQRKGISTIDSSGQHLLGLINDILDISKIEAGHEEIRLADFDLKGMLHGLDAMFAMRCVQKDLTWRLEENVSAAAVHGDEGKLRQVLINLLGNAVKFTSKGEVVLRVTAVEGERYTFEVCDTGPGIPLDRQLSIFEPFQQEEEGLRQGGTGLGLAISSRHIKMMEGEIQLESSPGVGSRFFFALRLPAAEALLVAQGATGDWSHVRHLAAGTSVRALVVDDVATNREVLTLLLSNIGVEVEEAEDGLQALERVSAQMPDIIFLDILMPVLDGPGTIKRLFAQYGKDATKVAAVTASVFEHQRKSYMEMGFVRFIDKPVRAAIIYQCLAEELGVEYDYLEELEKTEDANPQALDWRSADLPAKLYEELLSAVRAQSVTELRQHVTQVEALGLHGQLLAVHLRELAQRYDMAGIKAALDEVGG